MFGNHKHIQTRPQLQMNLNRFIRMHRAVLEEIVASISSEHFTTRSLYAFAGNFSGNSLPRKTLFTALTNVHKDCQLRHRLEIIRKETDNSIETVAEIRKNDVVANCYNISTY